MRTRLSAVVVAMIALLLGLLSACTGGSTTPAARTSTAAAQRGCTPASPIALNGGGPEVHGTGHGASLYGLVMQSTAPPIRAGDDVKIVWRMTGAGPLQLSAIDPAGAHRHLLFGPEFHSSSNYNRPGDEWGSGYHFDRAGCWDLHAQRTHGSADVWLEVRK